MLHAGGPLRLIRILGTQVHSTARLGVAPCWSAGCRCPPLPPAQSHRRRTHRRSRTQSESLWLELTETLHWPLRLLNSSSQHSLDRVARASLSPPTALRQVGQVFNDHVILCNECNNYSSGKILTATITAKANGCPWLGEFRRFQEDASLSSLYISNSSGICCVVVLYHIFCDHIVCVEQFSYFFSVASYCFCCCIHSFTEEMPATDAMTIRLVSVVIFQH